MNLVHLLLRSARTQPDRPALAVGRRVVRTYGAMASRVLGLSHSLRKTLQPGDRVALALKNCPEYYEILFACWHAGLVPVPINAKLHPKEIDYIVENSGARQLFGTPPEFPSGEGEAFASQPGDPAWLFYTSGTTGQPKGATLTHRNLLFQAQAYFSDIDALGPQDAILHAAPLSHGSGLYALPHFAAGAVNVIPESASFDPEEIFELLEHWRGMSFFAAPTMVVRLLGSRAARRPPGLKTIVYGGAPMYVADLKRALDLFGPRLYGLYGQGESPMTITGLPQDRHAEADLESCGFARTGVEVKVVDGEDRELPPGEIGEVVTRSDCVMAGYWRNPEATAQALRGGWLHTGDVGSMDGRSYLTLRDRSKDLIISGGSNIYPREVEEVLLRHPA
ncbi:MAG TPA: AMP-binding protein, partial [Burkholderiales bacterium]|nr:AMP-binding protein [Burkholderiales bacterium]